MKRALALGVASTVLPSQPAGATAAATQPANLPVNLARSRCR